MGNISKINANGVEYNIAQSGAVQDVSLAYNNSKFGSISINDKGNVAVESLSKHVNIEAVKGIQLKPTTNIIVDTSRRLADGKGNEAHLEVVYDDKGKEGAVADTSYGEFKIHARNFDLRCHDHGGIALQPCFCDHPNSDVPHFENKIKFESSRIAPITTRIGANDSVQVSDYDDTGGEGLEFGTFNNLHTSLFTKDYRFNKDGYVYAVNRGTPEIAEGDTKFDYPTQADDTKDIKVNKQRVDASGITTDVSLKANWEEIVWVARQYADGKIQGGGGTGGVEQQWVIDNFCSSTRADGFLTGIPNPLQYITESSKHNFQINVKDMSTYNSEKLRYDYANLNLEGNATVKVSALEDIELITKTNDIILSSTDKITQIGTKIKLYDISIDGSGNVVECEGGNGIVTVEAEKGLSMGLTPSVNFLSTKISAKGNIQVSSPTLGLMMLNNFDGSIYFDASNNEVHIPTDRIKEFFEDSACTIKYQPTSDKAKTVVYEVGGVKPTKSTEWFVKNTDLNRWFYVEINKDQQAKATPGILTEGTKIEDPSYIPTAGLTEMAPGEMKTIDSINLIDLFELVKHKDELLASLNK